MKILKVFCLTSLLLSTACYADDSKYNDLSENLTTLNTNIRKVILDRYGEAAASQYDVENSAWKILAADYCKSQSDKTQCHIEVTSIRIKALKKFLEDE